MSEFLHEVIKRRTTITTTTYLADDPWASQVPRQMAQWEEELISLLTPPPGNEPF